jgi:hypothetical protein
MRLGDHCCYLTQLDPEWNQVGNRFLPNPSEKCSFTL